MHFQSQLIIAVVALASLHQASSAVPTVPPAIGFSACNSSSFTCPANSVCNILNPCRYGRQCNCNPGYRDYSFYNSTLLRYIYQCVPATVKLGDQCTNNGPTARCAGQTTYCPLYNSTNGVCACTPGYVANSDGMDCSAPALAPLGGNCTANFCGYGASCSSTVCRCLPGYKQYNSTHCTHYKPGDNCNTVADCDFYTCALGSCKTGSYQCAPGLKWVQWNPNNDTNIVDGQCVANTVSVVGAGQYCGTNVLTSDNICGYGLGCSTCPEATGVNVCIGYGNGVSRLMTGSFLFVAMATVLSTLATSRR